MIKSNPWLLRFYRQAGDQKLGYLCDWLFEQYCQLTGADWGICWLGSEPAIACSPGSGYLFKQSERLFEHWHNSYAGTLQQAVLAAASSVDGLWLSRDLQSDGKLHLHLQQFFSEFGIGDGLLALAPFNDGHSSLFIGLFKHSGAFEPEAQRQLLRYLPHWMQACRLSWNRYLQGSAHHPLGQIVCDENGSLLECSNAFHSELARHRILSDGKISLAAFGSSRSDRLSPGRYQLTHFDLLISKVDGVLLVSQIYPRSLVRLSVRQLELAHLVAQGRSDKDIASLLGISVRTVRNRLSFVYQQLEIQGRASLAAMVNRTKGNRVKTEPTGDTEPDLKEVFSQFDAGGHAAQARSYLLSLENHPDIRQWKRQKTAILSAHNAPMLLELGVGSGGDIKHWLDTGVAQHIIAVDGSESLLSSAVTEHDERLSVLCARVESLPFRAEHFSLIHSERMLCHLVSPEQGFNEMLRILTPTGTMVLTEADYLNSQMSSRMTDLHPRIFRLLCSRFATPDIYPRLLLMLEQAKVKLVNHYEHPLRIHSLKQFDHIAAATPSLNNAIESGALTENEAHIWWEDLQALDRLGQFYCYVPFHTLVISK